MDEWGVVVLREAAERALQEDDPRSAVEFLDLAYDANWSGGEQTSIIALLADAEVRGNPSAAARRLKSLSSRLTSRTAGDSRVAHLVRKMLPLGLINEAVDILEGFDGRLDPQTIGELQAIHFWLSSSYPPALGEIPDHVRTASPPAGPPPISVEPKLRAAKALNDILRGVERDGAVRDAKQVLQSSSLADATFEHITSALMALIYADRIREVSRWCDFLIAESERRKAPAWQSAFYVLKAEALIRRGKLPAAERLTRKALALVPADGWGIRVGLPLSILLYAATAMGRHEEARGLLRIVVPDAMFQSRYGLHYLYARGRFFLSEGRLDAALRDFDSCSQLMTLWEIDAPSLVPWRAAVAAACIHSGNHARANEVIREQLVILGRGRSRVRGMSLRLLAATSSKETALNLLKESLDILRQCGDQLEVAHTLTALSRVYKDLGHSKKARTMALGGWHLAKNCQADPICEKLQPELERFNVDSSNRSRSIEGELETLSESERKVAELAAHGDSNREIAQKLYITVSTVEQHLTRVYRKLNIRRRSELPVDLHLGGL